MDDVVSTNARLEIDGVGKRFGRNIALDDVSISISPGEIRGVVGRNGAGKSTLMGVASGLLKPDTGRVLVNGKDTGPLTLAQYREIVGMVHQHSNLIKSLSIAENLQLGAAPPTRNGLIDWKELDTQAQTLLDEWETGLQATQPVAELTLAQRQLVEIIRELARGVDVVILDEPTSRLEKADVSSLFDNVRRVSDGGTAVIYISHHLSEIHDLCHSVTTLRDGRLVATRMVAETSEEQLVQDMVGSTAGSRPSQRSHTEFDAQSSPVLEVSKLRSASLRDLSISISPGQCVGIAGLIGSGKEDIGLILGGMLRPESGSATINGRRVELGTVGASLKAGIGFLSPDRHDTGLVLSMSVQENVTMTIWDRIQNALGLLTPQKLDASASVLAGATGVATIGDHHQAVGLLSGGNQQKVALGRAIANDPRVLVLMNPTTGVDIASKQTIYELIRKQLDSGVAVVLISDEIDEFLFCNQIVALFRGEVAKVFEGMPEDGELVAAIEGVGVHAGS